MRRPARSSPAASPPPPTRPAVTVPLTTRPTPEFVRQHDIAPPRIDSVAFHPGWQVTTRLRALLDLGRIDREAFDAALEWRRHAEVIAPSHTSSLAPRVDVSAVPNDAGMLHRVRAAGWLRECTEALGPLRIKLLVGVRPA